MPNLPPPSRPDPVCPWHRRLAPLVRLGTWLVVAALGFSARSLPGPIFMEYEGVPGEVQAEGYRDWIETSSVQFGVGVGVSAPTGGSVREVSLPSFSELTVTKALDRSSPFLFIHPATHPAGTTVKIHCVNGATELRPYLIIELEDVIVSGYSLSSGGDQPSESISFNFAKITYTYRSYDQTGGSSDLVASYDLATATATAP